MVASEVSGGWAPGTLAEPWSVLNLQQPCHVREGCGMKSTFLSPLDGLFSQVMGNMDNLGGGGCTG